MIAVERAHLYVTASTHEGMKGKNNEDRYAISAHRVSRTDPTPSLFAMVCDGIGGHRAGEVAAEMAVEIISKALAESDAQQPLQILEQAVSVASQAIRKQADQNPNQGGMGSTCVVTWILGEQLYSVSVGDSRLYLMRRDAIYQLTTDHTWVQEAIEYGALTPEQAKNHPNVHVIRRYLGSQTPVQPDFRLHLSPDETDEQAIANQGMRLLPGDLLLMCTDGLTDLVEPGEILAMLKEKGREAGVQALINLANQRGGHDNITIVVLDAPAGGGKPEDTLIVPAQTIRRRPALLLTCIGITALVVILALLGVVIFWVVMRSNWFPEPTPMPTQMLPAIFPVKSGTPLAATEPAGVGPSPQRPVTTPVETATVRPASTHTGPTYTPWPTNTLPSP